MSYRYENPSRITRKQSFSVGMATGLGVAGLVALILSVIDPKPRAPRFSELAVVCTPSPETAVSPYRHARWEESELRIFCQGGIR